MALPDVDGGGADGLAGADNDADGASDCVALSDVDGGADEPEAVELVDKLAAGVALAAGEDVPDGGCMEPDGATDPLPPEEGVPDGAPVPAADADAEGASDCVTLTDRDGGVEPPGVAL